MASLNSSPVRPFALPQVVPEARSNDKTGFAVIVLLGYMFLLLSRSIEFIDRTGSLHLMLLGAIAAMAMAVISGGFFRAMATKSGLWLTAATVWMVIGVPFSIWVGGSVNGLVNGWLKSYLVFFIVAGILTNLSQCRKLAISIAFSTGCVILITLMMGGDSSDAGRVTAGGGTLGNSNDLATQLLIGLPFCIHVVTDKKRNSLIRIFFLAVSGAAFFVGMKTGSRGALLSVLVLAALLLWKASGAARAAIVVTLVAGVVLAPLLLTDELKARYMTAFKGNDYAQSLSGDAAEAADSALLSTQARTEMIHNAINLSLHHPLMGVGFGQFQVADAQRAGAAGEEAYWHEVHNGFLVVLVEDGLPAVIFVLLSFGYAYFLVFRIYNRTQKSPKDHEIARMALCLLASLTAYFVCLNFSPGAYGVQLPVLAGFASAFDMIVKKHRQNEAVEAKAVAAAPKLSLPVSPLAKARRKAPAWRP